MKGTVKWFNNQKGVCFISDAEGHDVSVHYSGLTWMDSRHLKKVRSGIRSYRFSARGPQAVNVTPL